MKTSKPFLGVGETFLIRKQVKIASYPPIGGRTIMGLNQKSEKTDL